MLENKYKFDNADGTQINIPDNESLHLFMKHVQSEYPDIYAEHFGSLNFKSSRSLMGDFDGNFDEIEEDVQNAYIEFLLNLKQAVIMPDGSEVLCPVSKPLPVGCHHPKTLEEMMMESVNVGKIFEESERLEELRYDEEREYALFEELHEVAQKNPERFRSLYADADFNQYLTNTPDNVNPVVSDGHKLDIENQVQSGQERNVSEPDGQHESVS